jgi:hypothetical protein
VSYLLGWLTLVPLAIAVAVFRFLLRPQERIVVEYEDARGRRRRVSL